MSLQQMGGLPDGEPASAMLITRRVGVARPATTSTVTRILTGRITRRDALVRPRAVKVDDKRLVSQGTHADGKDRVEGEMRIDDVCRRGQLRARPPELRQPEW